MAKADNNSDDAAALAAENYIENGIQLSCGVKFAGTQKFLLNLESKKDRFGRFNYVVDQQLFDEIVSFIEEYKSNVGQTGRGKSKTGEFKWKEIQDKMAAAQKALARRKTEENKHYLHDMPSLDNIKQQKIVWEDGVLYRCSSKTKQSFQIVPVQRFSEYAVQWWSTNPTATWAEFESHGESKLAFDKSFLEYCRDDWKPTNDDADQIPRTKRRKTKTQQQSRVPSQHYQVQEVADGAVQLGDNNVMSNSNNTQYVYINSESDGIPKRLETLEAEVSMLKAAILQYVITIPPPRADSTSDTDVNSQDGRTTPVRSNLQSPSGLLREPCGDFTASSHSELSTLTGFFRSLPTSPVAFHGPQSLRPPLLEHDTSALTTDPAIRTPGKVDNLDSDLKK